MSPSVGVKKEYLVLNLDGKGLGPISHWGVNFGSVLI